MVQNTKMIAPPVSSWSGWSIWLGHNQRIEAGQEERYEYIRLGHLAPISDRHKVRTNNSVIFRNHTDRPCGLGLLMPCGTAVQCTCSQRSTFVRLGHVVPLYSIHMAREPVRPVHNVWGSSCTAFGQKVVVEGWMSGSGCRWRRPVTGRNTIVINPNSYAISSL